jgi:hypothetical protein
MGWAVAKLVLANKTATPSARIERDMTGALRNNSFGR